MTSKSPFLVYQDFISPLTCEEIISKVSIREPVLNKDGYPEKLERFHADCEKTIFERFKPLVPEIEQHYNFKYRGTESLLFQYFPTSNDLAEKPGCANSQFLRKKWVKVKDRDLTGILWLKDFNDTVPIDLRHEVYGGKLEFPQYGFSLQPQRGTLVLYPAYPNFITAISQVLVGDLYCVRFNVSAENWLYQAADFPGTWQEWLAAFA
jgi:hypothetical protein